MAKNLEIKARVADLSGLRQVVSALTDAPGTVIVQTDTFFVVPRGRLKVRTFEDGSGELIAYDRPDSAGPKESIYTRVPSGDAASLVRALGALLPIRGVVRKRRELFLVGRTRVHLDEVEGLGSFVELEVVLDDSEPAQAGEADARSLMTALGIAPDALISEAYIDLIERAAR